MTDKEQIAALYEAMYQAMSAKDTVALGKILSEDSVLVHMTGHLQPRQEYLREIASGVLNYYSVNTDSLDITLEGDTARMVGKSRVNAAVYGGGRHTWRLRMDSQLRKIDGEWFITYSKASTY
jgi:ketosteroid isomerase-like protein